MLPIQHATHKVSARSHKSDSTGLTSSQIRTSSDFFSKPARSRRHDMGQTKATDSIVSLQVHPCDHNSNVVCDTGRSNAQRRKCWKSNYTEPKTTTNSHLPQKRQPPRPAPKKRPFELIATPTLCKERERERQRERYLKQSFCGPYPRAADSETPKSPWHRPALLHENSYTLFPLSYFL